MQINCFQRVCFIHAIFLSASLKTRLVRNLCYHSLPTKDCDFLHYFQNRWEIIFPEISFFNGNVSILMQNFKRIILEWLKMKMGHCSPTLSIYVQPSHVPFIVTLEFFLCQKCCCKVVSMSLDTFFSFSPNFFLDFVYSFTFWIFILN